jgi:hypothetical protein
MCLSQPAFSDPCDVVAGNMMLINDNAGWCWYQDDKIIYDPASGNIITSTSGCDYGFGGASGETRSNDVDATTFNIDLGKRTRALMAERGGDDHNMGGLWIRPDGRYLHLYCPHYSPSTTYFRVSTNPNDGSAWDSEQSYNWTSIGGPSGGGNLTYTNLHYLSAEGTNGRLYNIVRWNNVTPNIAYSDNNGVTWHYMGKLNSQTVSGYSNYYHKFRSNGVDRIDFIGVEAHPRDFNNSVYHGYIKGGKSYDSYGDVIDDDLYDQDAPSIRAFTPIFVASTPAADTYHTAWTNELELDKDGFPVCLYQTRHGTQTWGDDSGSWGNIGAADHRFFYARFNGSEWHSYEICKLGTALHRQEQDYEGMGCIHPDDANIVYVSTNFHPVTDVNVGHREIFKGVTYDNGEHWSWTQITFDSTVDNIRPAIPPWNAHNTAVFWERGDFPTQGHFDMVMVGLVEEQDMTLGLVSYIDASPSNTTNADGSAFSPTGPSGSAGSADGLWHEYTGYGNGGSCYTAGDGGTENVPTIKTTITGLSDGTYDVFAYFWCDPDADWGIRGGFESSDMLCFNKQSSQFADASQFSGSVTVTGTGVQLYRVYIGRKEISGGGSVVVYLDNYDSTYSTNAPTRTTYDGIGVAGVSYVEDVWPPEPNKMTWATVPTATGPTTITMTATTADDNSPPVQYYFECTTDGDANSDWQTSPTYVAEGLSPSTLYTFKVKARDSSPAQNETDWSAEESATTGPPDTTPPTPDPCWASPPTATGPYSITMTSTTSTDVESPPVYYYFECTNDGSKSSSWQSSTTYTAQGLTPSTQYSFRVKARDSYTTPNETGWSSTQSATTEETPPGPEFSVGTVSDVGSSWEDVTLSRSYNSMVVVATANYDNTKDPAVVRIQNASGNSFQVRVDAAGGATPSGIDVHYMVAEEGVYTIAEHGIKMEAVKYLSTVTDNDSSWVGQSRSYSNSYSSPVVLGQVMTYNDPDFSTFWCRGSASGNPPDSSNLYTGKTVSEDSDTTRDDETIGYIVIEAGSGTIGDVNYVADLGSNAIQGVGDSPPYTYSISGLSSPNVAIASCAGMNGFNGGWAILYGANPLTSTSLNLAIDEDVVSDTERNHASEEVGYIVFESKGTTFQNCADVLAGGYRFVSDLSGDCYVNYIDLKIITSHWLADCTEPDNCEGADFAPTDGIVDLYDFSDFAVQWLLCNNPTDANCTPNW